ncbi:helix-turn-helix domain-containing protein [Nocardia sp. CDC160]|uniref:helix-turn-helix domain-containing protein n=1 Tax=Nocardia sp. CDC160 TaxID=3112166 RepID=UPI002DBABBAB|nr:helix-turn-helix domain-containing protein [Nocardia sp. CDC160]MEC3914556.1 helix-turn-helix domain-containing protein [Nocardia sp. CDC160]
MTTAQAPTSVVTAEDLEQLLMPSDVLRPWISEIAHIPVVRPPATAFTHVPQAATTIVVRRGVAGRRDVLVVGPRTRATYADPNKPAGCTRIRLAPGATQSLLGVPAVELTDRVALLSDMPGVAAKLAAALTELAPEDVASFLEDELPQRLSEDATRRDHRRLVGSAVAAMDTAASVGELAAALAVSERQLRNLFTAGIGVSPKHYARIVRLRQVLSAAGNTPWSHVASASGYYDQSHMTADFRSLMGVPPTAYFRGDVPAPSPCQTVTRGFTN